MSMMKFTLRMMGWKYHNKQEACVKLKSMMHVYVKGSIEAVKLYEKAFNAEIFLYISCNLNMRLANNCNW